MKFFIAAASLSPLEILHGIRSVSNRLHGCEHMHSRSFQRIAAPPAYGRRSALHEQERRFFQSAHNTVVCSGAHCCRDFILLLVPEGITVPRDDIKPFFQPVIIQPFEKVHKICRRRYIRLFLHRPDLHFTEVTELLSRESAPVHDKRCARHLPIGARTVDLAPVSIRMTPEMIPPCIIKIVQCSVLLLQPFTKRFLTQFAMAGRISEVASKLIGDVPQDHIFSLSEPPCKFSVYSCSLLSHHR